MTDNARYRDQNIYFPSLKLIEGEIVQRYFHSVRKNGATESKIGMTDREDIRVRRELGVKVGSRRIL